MPAFVAGLHQVLHENGRGAAPGRPLYRGTTPNSTLFFTSAQSPKIVPR
jgi:hypothetical protein